MTRNDQPPSFGSLLKTYRTRRRLTQQQLAKMVGVHRNTISAWELGRYFPDARELVLNLAGCLRLDVQEARQLLEASLTALPPPWSVPFPRNPFFTGREEILKAIHSHLHTHQTTSLFPSYALQGLGGMGKTQIAIEYAYRHALEYSAIFWVGAETADQVRSSVVDIARSLQVPVQQTGDQSHFMMAVRHWLATHSQWLLIWDNLEDPELLQRFLPPLWQGALLITTRSQTIGTLTQGMNLAPMEREEGILFVLRRAKLLGLEVEGNHLDEISMEVPTNYVTAAKLVQLMGGLPLALDQIGAYVEETGCRLSDYLWHYERQQLHLLDRRGSFSGDGEHPHSVATTFLLAITQVKQETARDLLYACAFLHAEAIPEDFFLVGAPHLGPLLNSFFKDPSLFDQAVAALRNLSLVQRHAQTHTLSIHHLLQLVLREQMSKQEQEMWQRRVSAALNAVFPEVSQNVWKRCERLLPHVLACANLTPDDVGDASLAVILRKAGDYLRERAYYEQAEPLYQRAVSIEEQTQRIDVPGEGRTLRERFSTHFLWTGER